MRRLYIILLLLLGVSYLSDAQTVQVLTPNGGENFDISQGTYIQWNSTGITDVKLEYSSNGGTSWNTIVASYSAASAYYYWITPNDPSTNCLVKISDASNASVFDYSDNSFEINPAFIEVYSPYGGEMWGIGTSQYISWDAPGVTNVNIEYSTDGGATWGPVVSNYTASIDYYYWTIPNDPSTDCLIKITDASNASLYDISSAVFTIPVPTLDLTDPDGGESWGAQSGQYIYWNSYSIQNVKLEYSLDSGATWNTIIASTSAAPEYYYWIIPNVQSTTALVKISDVSNPTLNDISLAVFTIYGPSITVSSPDGFENWSAGTQHYISWYCNGISNVDLKYSTNNGSTWKTIALNEATSSNGYYYWTVPADYSTQCRVKVSATSDSTIYDVSDDVFTIPAPSITVDQPNGGEIWGAGSQHYIYWTQSSLPGVNLYYSPDNGVNWTLIVDSLPSTAYYYYWTIPADYSNEALVKAASMANSSVYDVSNSTFTIPAPTISVTYPNGGETWGAFTQQYISWNAPSVSRLRLEFSADNGSSWTLIADSVVASTGYYYWEVPYTPSTNCLVKITDVASSLVYDVSNAVFTIPLPSLSLWDPTGGEIWDVGTQRYISWTGVSVDELTVEYSTNNGASWTVISTNANGLNSGMYWTVPNTPSTECLVRITDNLNTTISDQSDSTFTIPPPAIAVTVPNGGEQWGGGSSRYIQWYAPSLQNVKIEYTIDNGSTWNTIVSSIASSSGSYQWTVPSTPSNNCKVRVSDTGTSGLMDASDNNFSIPQPTVTVLSPNGGEVWSVGAGRTISWTSATVANVKVELTRDNGATWSTLASSVPALNGYYYWYPQLPGSSDAKIKVTSTANAAITDMSDSVFTIAGPSIALTSPIGGETWFAGSQYYITWTSNGINNVKIEYTTDNEATWNMIHPGAPDYGYFYWTLPSNINSTTCKVRVTSTLNASLTSKSLGTFSIVPPTASLSVNSPNGGETFYMNNSYYVTWTSSAIANVKIELSRDNGTTWSTLVSSFPTTNGFYYWNVNALPSANCKIRISDAANASMNDVSDAVFAIAPNVPTITVTSPNGGETWYVSSYHQITWTTNNVPAVNVSYSSNAGSSWTLLASNVTTNSFYWNIPNTISSTCLVKIESSSSSAISDTSDSFFAIDNAPANNNVITTTLVTPPVFCKRDTITVGYSAVGTFNSGNIFTAQISDSAGTFNYPQIIGSLSSTTSGSITCVIPAYLPNSSLYKIRVVSDNLPANGSPDTGTFILNSPHFNFSANSVIKYLPDGLVSFTHSGQAGSSYSWDFGDGSTSSIINPSHTYTQIGYKNVSLTVSNVAGCALTVTKPFYIRVERLLPNVNINTYTFSDITAVTFKNDTVGCVATADGACIVTDDGGQTFQSYPTGLSTLKSANWVSGVGIFVTGPNGAISKSLNSGQSWIPLSTSTTETLEATSFFSNGQGIAVGTSGKIMTYAGGTSWNSSASGTSANLRSVSSIGSSKAVAVGENGTILRSTDSGANWSSTTSPVSNKLNHVVFADSLTGYIAAENGVLLLSTDGGASWNVTLAGVDVSFTSVAVSRTGDTAWAVSNSGVIYKSTNKGSTWGRYSKGSTNDNTGATYKSTRGYVGGKGGDLKMFDAGADTSSIGIKENISIGSNFELYPNPSSDRFTFSFDISGTSDVSYYICDINGRRVSPMIEKENNAGSFYSTVSVADLRQGIYFLHVSTAGGEFVHKVIVTR